MKDLDECDYKDLNDYEKMVTPLVDHIHEWWDVSTLAPKGYEEYLTTYEDYQDMGPDIPSVKTFTGPKNPSACSHDFPTTVSMPHVAYSDTNQGRDPLTTLIGACVTYGMDIERRRNDLNRLPDDLSPEMIDFVRKLHTKLEESNLQNKNNVV